METKTQTQPNPPMQEIRRPTHSFLIKTIAVLLFTALFTVSLGSLAGAAAAYIDMTARSEQQQIADSRMLKDLIQYQYNYRVSSTYRDLYRTQNGTVSADLLADDLHLDKAESNYRYVITDGDGTVLAGNIADETVLPVGKPSLSVTELVRLPSGELVEQTKLEYAASEADSEITVSIVSESEDEEEPETPEAAQAGVVPSSAPAPSAAGSTAAVTEPAGNVPAQDGAQQTVPATPAPKAPVSAQAGNPIESATAGLLPSASPAATQPGNPAEAASETEASEPITLTLAVQGYYVNPPVADDDIASAVRVASFLNVRRDALLTCGIVTAVLALIVFVFLLCAAGRHSDSAAPRRSWIDRIPFDVLLLLSLGALFLDAFVISAFATSIPSFRFFRLLLTCAGFFGAINALWFIMMCMTFAARIKTRTFWRNNVCIMLVCFCWRLIKGVCRWIRGLFTGLPILWRGIVAFFAVGLVLLISFVSAQNGSGFAGLVCFASVVGLFVLMISTLRQINRLKLGGEALAKGDLSKQIETKGMFRDFREHGENLNSIAAGMNKAVNERMKSERMKTDLITNVSHDLKTPLTSIVSFVDLLKKEDLHNETAAGYVAVLDRQAARLKKLTEDLVEASKASSGALKVSLAPTDVCEVLNQSLAEYGDRLRQAQLTCVSTRRSAVFTANAGIVHIAPGAILNQTGPILVQADGRLLWRVFDNLLNNIVKYAMPGTRVYIDILCAQAGEKNVAIAFKNISSEPLNIPAAELTERFVRGDASRSAEGSGLGLSIAKSLAELQHALFQLEISGDLFTATVLLEASEATSVPEGFAQMHGGALPEAAAPALEAAAPEADAPAAETDAHAADASALSASPAAQAEPSGDTPAESGHAPEN